MQVCKHALLWTRNDTTNVVITSSAGSAHPVGAAAFLLDDSFPAAASDQSSSTEAASGPAAQLLGRSTYAAAATHHEAERGKLLTGVWRNIASQMLPFLHASSKKDAGAGDGGARGASRAAVLLTGPERGGKAMEAEAAARALGLHVLEVDCRQLAASPMDEAECIVQLHTILQQAQAYAPCILLLRRLERIFPQQPNVAVVRRFADLLTAESGAMCQPHIPEVARLPEPGDEPTEPPPPCFLEWGVLHSPYRSDGTRAELPPGTTRRELAALHERFAPAVSLVVGTTSRVADVPVPLRRCFTTEIAVPALAEPQRQLAIRHTLANASGMADDDLRVAAQATAGFLPCDIGAAACDAVLQVMLERLQGNESTSGADPGKVRQIVSAH